MKFLSLISAAFAFFNRVFDYFEQRRLRAAGAAEANLKRQEDDDAAIAKSKKARDDVIANLARDPSGLRDDDEFRRAD